MSSIALKLTRFGIESHNSIWDHLDPPKKTNQKKFTKTEKKVVNRMHFLMEQNEFLLFYQQPF